MKLSLARRSLCVLAFGRWEETKERSADTVVVVAGAPNAVVRREEASVSDCCSVAIAFASQRTSAGGGRVYIFPQRRSANTLTYGTNIVTNLQAILMIPATPNPAHAHGICGFYGAGGEFGAQVFGSATGGAGTLVGKKTVGVVCED